MTAIIHKPFGTKAMGSAQSRCRKARLVVFEALPETFKHCLVHRRCHLFTQRSFQEHLKNMRAGGQDQVSMLRSKPGSTLGLWVNEATCEVADILC
jgi:hypothetical protein